MVKQLRNRANTAEAGGESKAMRLLVPPLIWKAVSALKESSRPGSPLSVRLLTPERRWGLLFPPLSFKKSERRIFLEKLSLSLKYIEAQQSPNGKRLVLRWLSACVQLLVAFLLQQFGYAKSGPGRSHGNAKHWFWLEWSNVCASLAAHQEARWEKRVQLSGKQSGSAPKRHRLKVGCWQRPHVMRRQNSDLKLGF